MIDFPPWDEVPGRLLACLIFCIVICVVAYILTTIKDANP